MQNSSYIPQVTGADTIQNMLKIFCDNRNTNGFHHSTLRMRGFHSNKLLAKNCGIDSIDQ